MGKLGRCIGPLIARRYQSRTEMLTRTLRRSPLWRYNAGSLPPRETPFLLQQPCGAHSDARGIGHIGFRVISDRVPTFHTRLPSCFVCMAQEADGVSSIYLSEICAAMLTSAIVSEITLTITRPCVICIDNQESMASLAKDATSSDLGTCLVGVFWAVAAIGPAQWWLEYVRAKPNDSDEPSRTSTAQLGNDFPTHKGMIPDAFSQALQSWESPHRDSARQ